MSYQMDGVTEIMAYRGDVFLAPAFKCDDKSIKIKPAELLPRLQFRNVDESIIPWWNLLHCWMTQSINPHYPEKIMKKCFLSEYVYFRRQGISLFDPREEIFNHSQFVRVSQSDSGWQLNFFFKFQFIPVQTYASSYFLFSSTVLKQNSSTF